VAMIELFGKLF